MAVNDATRFANPTVEAEAFTAWKNGTPLSEISIKYGVLRDFAYKTFIRLAGGMDGFKRLRAAGAGARGGGKSTSRKPRTPMPAANGTDTGTVREIARHVADEVFVERMDEVLNREEVQELIKLERFSIAKFVKDEMAKVQGTQELVVKVPGQTAVTVTQSHSQLKEVLRRLSAGFNNMLCVGPAGSGKTTLAAQTAKCLKREFGFISLSGGTTEGALLGRMSSTGKYIPSLFVEIYEKGGVFLLDEVDAADANVLLVLNSALANGDLAVPARAEKPVAKRHKNTVIMCAANTWGTGADWQYVGRNQLDAAFLSRFAGAVLKVDYDEQLERSLVSTEWYNDFLRVRHTAMNAKLRRILGTREMIAGEKLLKAGYTKAEAWECLTAGWTVDELRVAKVTA